MAGTRLRALERHLAPVGRAAAEVMPVPTDPYPDPGDYRGTALPFVTKPSAAEGLNASAGSAADPPVLTPEDHAHFLRTGFIHLKGIIPPESVTQTLESLEQPTPDCVRTQADPSRELRRIFD